MDYCSLLKKLTFGVLEFIWIRAIVARRLLLILEQAPSLKQTLYREIYFLP